MPSKSAAQARLMRAVAHGWHKPGGGGPSKSVAQEFTAADKGHKFRSGGHVKKRRSKGPKINPAMLAAMAGPPPGAAGPPPPPMGGPPPGGPPPGMKKGGEVKTTKTEAGGSSHIGGGIERKGKTSTKLINMRGAGKASKGTTPTRVYAGGGSVRGHGIESKGRTRGRFV